VDSDSTTSNSKSNELVDNDVLEGAGEMGNTVVVELGTRTGKVGDGSEDESAVLDAGGAGIPVGRP
jgi:hypothetical protein